MEVKLSTVLEITQSSSLPNLSDLKSYLRGNGCEDNSFLVQNVHQKVVEIKAGDDLPSSLDIFDFFNLDAGDVTFVHLQMFNSDPEEYNVNDIRFSLQLGGVDIGDHSLFALYNIQNFNSDIVITAVSVPVSTSNPLKKGVLLVVVGAKN